ncbi:MAG TPA: hypothetical protein VFY27_04850 [Woeseiaceae bacterium]|nr:hypothetical protein [Woeseiaceae bacterium]
MAERLKDEYDAKLEALFRSAPLEDDGFSKRVVWRVRRGIWIRRWTLPLAILVGGLIAAKPAAELLLGMAEILAVLPEDVRNLELDALPQVTTFIFGGMVAALIGLFLKGLEE